MPSKSRRRRGKRSSQIKRAKMRQVPSAVAPEQPAVAETYEPVSPPEPVAPVVSKSTSVSRATTHYPYIFTELRRIGILAGIMLVILVIAALVLS
jgi:hypothetical protein